MACCSYAQLTGTLSSVSKAVYLLSALNIINQKSEYAVLHGSDKQLIDVMPAP